MTTGSAPSVAVVTGGASGIGFALAKRFLADGRAVAIADVDLEALERAVSELAATGGRVIGVPTDVADADSVTALATRVLNELGVPDVLCNNAGVNAYGFRSWEAPPATWQWIWGVNVLGVVNGIASFVPHMISAGRGWIVNTASVAGLASAPGISAYAASKHAVVAISESLRAELLEIGSPVGVSVVCPALIATDIGQSARHWPDRLGRQQALGPSAAEYTGRLESARANAPGPELVANAVADAIATNRFLVFPDDQTAKIAHAKRMAVFTGEDQAEAEWFR